MAQLPIYVINLDRRPDRWALVSANLDRLGLVAKRIAAVDAQSLAGDPAAARMGAGHVACARSHYKAFAALLATEAPAALVLEDDVELGGAVAALTASADWWPEGHGLVKLASAIRPDKRIWMGHAVARTPDGRRLRRIAHSHLGAYGYMIDREAAGAALGIAPATPMPIDHLLFNLTNSALARRLKPLQMAPGAIRHRSYEVVGSDTGVSRIGGRKLWKQRPVVRAGYKLAWLWTAMAGKARLDRVGYDAGTGPDS